MRSAALTALYRGHVGQTRARVRTNVLGAFDALNGIDDATAETFAARAATIVAAGQRVTMNQTIAYMRLIARAETGSGFERPAIIGGPIGDRVPITRPGQAGDATPLRRVYMKPFFELWQRLAKGHAREAATLAARRVLDQHVATDLTLAARNTAHLVVQHDPRVAGWMRVSSHSPCSRCGSGAGLLFHRDDPLPIHIGDSCFVRPVYDAGGRVVVRTNAVDSVDYGPIFQQEPTHA